MVRVVLTAADGLPLVDKKVPDAVVMQTVVGLIEAHPDLPIYIEGVLLLPEQRAALIHQAKALRLGTLNSLDKLTMEIAWRLQAFEQMVAVEQAELRDRLNQQTLETAKLRAALRHAELTARELLARIDAGDSRNMLGGDEVHVSAPRRVQPRRSRLGRCWPCTEKRRPKIGAANRR